MTQQDNTNAPAGKPAKKVRPGKTKVKAKNNSKRTINLQSGPLESGKTGEATLAECGTYSKYIKEVKAF